MEEGQREMMQHWINWRQVLLDDDSLNFYEKSLGMFLSTYMNESQDFAFPSLGTLCGRLGIGKTTAVKYLASLEEKGWIAKQQRFHSSTVYYALVPAHIRKKILSQSSRDELSLRPQMQSQSSRGEPVVVREANPNSQRNSQDKNKRRPIGYSLSFEEWWQTYPRKDNKAQAAKAWERLSKADREKASSDVTSRNWPEDRKFIPHGSTYLNGRRWEDEKEDTSTKGYDMRGMV